MALRVLVTRPEPAAARTAARLAAGGHVPVLLPLVETVGLAAVLDPAAAAAATAVAATSANALRHAAPALLRPVLDRRFYAVGQRTAEAAAAAGFSDVVTGAGDAADLAATLVGAAPRGTLAVYLCGRVRRADFERVLGEGGLRIVAVETYDAPVIGYASDMVLARLSGGPVDAVLVYSARAAAAVSALARRKELAHLFGTARFLCISRRAAAELGGVAPDRIAVAQRPEEEALRALLDAAAPVQAGKV
ncbi:MAG: uroporphyrinogen-III synthase [Mesorhizobium sp.]